MKKQIKKYWRAIFGEPTDKSSYKVYKIKEIPCFEESPNYMAVEYYSIWYSGFGRYNKEVSSFKSKDKDECLRWIEWRKNKSSVKIEKI